LKVNGSVGSVVAIWLTARDAARVSWGRAVVEGQQQGSQQGGNQRISRNKFTPAAAGACRARLQYDARHCCLSCCCITAQDRAPPVVSAGYRPSPVAGADTCTPEERNKERARKAARTRAQRYGARLLTRAY